MADQILPNTGIMKPHVGPGGTGNWGDKLNDNWQELDDRFTPTPPADQVVGAGATGTSDNVARADHVHPMAPIDIGDIADNSIDGSKIVDGSIGTVELADGAVTSAKIADGTIVNADVAAGAAIANSKLAALTPSRALVSDPSGVISPSGVPAADLAHVAGVTSPIQTQISALQAKDVTHDAQIAPLQAIDRLRVTAQGTPGTTVAVAAGVYTKSDGTATVTFAGGNSPAFAVVTANSRIDLLTIDDTGTLGITQGIQAASPVPVTYPTTKIVLAEVTISQTTGPAITQAMIKDVRPYLNLGSGGGSSGTPAMEYVAYVVGTPSGSYSGSTTVFDLPFTYVADGKNIGVFYNGQQLKYGTDYSETTNSKITMTSALVTGAAVWFRAVSGAVGAPAAVTLRREDYIVGTALNNYTGSLTVFDLVNTFNVGGNAMMVTLDGDVQTKGATADYLETDSDTITFNTALVAGQRISFIWSQAVGSASGTVNTGTAQQLAVYAGTGATVSGTPAITTDGSSVSTTVPTKIKGSTTNDSAAAGEVGEYVQGLNSASSNALGTNVYGDLTFMDLTAGDWDVSMFCFWEANGATISQFQGGISTVSGNSSAGLGGATNLAEFNQTNSATAVQNIPLIIPRYRVSITSTTRYYMKYAALYTAGTPRARGLLSARRVR